MYQFEHNDWAHNVHIPEELIRMRRFTVFFSAKHEVKWFFVANLFTSKR
jgi:hypothetical protein